MSLSKGLRALARAPVRTKALTAGDLIAAGYPADGTDVAEDYARKLSVVDRCVEILSDSMAKLPIYLFDSRTRERIDHPLLYLINIRPNERGQEAGGNLPPGGRQRVSVDCPV